MDLIITIEIDGDFIIFSITTEYNFKRIGYLHCNLHDLSDSHIVSMLFGIMYTIKDNSVRGGNIFNIKNPSDERYRTIIEKIKQCISSIENENLYDDLNDIQNEL